MSFISEKPCWSSGPFLPTSFTPHWCLQQQEEEGKVPEPRKGEGSNMGPRKPLEKPTPAGGLLPRSACPHLVPTPLRRTCVRAAVKSTSTHDR